MNLNKFLEELEKINIYPTNQQLKQLEKYYELIVEYNKVMNLTGITDKEQVYLKHFYDSLTLNKIIDLNKEYSLCDIGSGAGFPGIVLKIIFPKLKITLLDSLNKRIEFLNIVIKELKLQDIETKSVRVEEFGKNNREKYDIVTARAVAPLNILLEYAIPLVKEHKYFIPMKANLEIGYQNALKILNSKILKTEEFKLPVEQSQRTLLLIQKEKKTNKLFPRNNSKIKKQPL
jgi:16S rRNA (guanine527-N7)-methyltransferase